MTLRQFSTFSLESYFPKDIEVTTDNYNKYHWNVLNQKGEFISMMYKSELCKNQVEAFVNGTENQVRNAIQGYLNSNYNRLDCIKSLL